METYSDAREISVALPFEGAAEMAEAIADEISLECGQVVVGRGVPVDDLGVAGCEVAFEIPSDHCYQSFVWKMVRLHPERQSAARAGAVSGEVEVGQREVGEREVIVAAHGVDGRSQRPRPSEGVVSEVGAQLLIPSGLLIKAAKRLREPAR